MLTGSWPLSLLLAQSAATRQEAVSILVWLIVIVGAGILVAVVGFFIWRAYNRQDESSLSPSTAFTLDDLRQLYRQGQLTDAEYERARTAIIARTRASMGKSSSALDAPADSDSLDSPGLPPSAPFDSDEPDPPPHSDKPPST